MIMTIPHENPNSRYMIARLMKALGWVRRADYAVLEEKIAALELESRMLAHQARDYRYKADHYREKLGEALRPSISKLVHQQVRGAVVSRSEDHMHAYTTYRLVLPEVVLYAHDDHFTRLLRESETRELVAGIWAHEFKYILPTYLEKLV